MLVLPSTAATLQIAIKTNQIEISRDLMFALDVGVSIRAG